MRLDKYLKVSRLIKRRTVANEACDAGKVLVNDKVARASYDVKVGDVIAITMGARTVKVKVSDAAHNGAGGVFLKAVGDEQSRDPGEIVLQIACAVLSERPVSE